MPRHTRLGLLIAAMSVGMVTAGSPGSAARPAIQAPLDSLLGVFEGRTPCDRIATDFTGFPSQGCEKIKWRLTLYRHPVSGKPSSYLYEGTRTSRTGHWRSAAGAGPHRDRVIYHLTPSGPGSPLSLLSIDDRVLLLLDRTGQVLVGDASWSHVLNRIGPPPR